MARTQNEKGFPWKHVFGFLLSIVLTLLAVWIAFSSGLPAKTIIALIVILAFCQAFIQLVLFMHMNEGASGSWQATMIYYGIYIAIVIVAGSIWVMTFGHQHHH
mgnify:CR=1 FL=1